jgi:transcription elongation GreA/GreB family factor
MPAELRPTEYGFKHRISMTKDQLIQNTLLALKDELDNAIAAAQQAHDGATHEQSKAETQYDTLGLEHAYLAQGQSRRINELTHGISLLENWRVKDFCEEDEIYLGALITLKAVQSHDLMNVLLAPAGGGILIKIEECEYHMVTPQTPLGQALIGLTQGETVALNNGRQYEIISLS